MDPPTSTAGGKLRLMCSYGGYIVPRPNSKSLCYVGGETRIVSIPASTALSVLSVNAHLASTLHFTAPFTVKYQLPHHDLDALISLANDDDLQIMLEENERLSASLDPSRIRLFIFPIKSNPIVYNNSSISELNGGGFGLGLSGADLIPTELNQVQVQSSPNELNHPKTESWFDDALRSTKILQKGDGVGGFGGESGGNGQNEGSSLCGQESIVLETNSSFGSTSSSVSWANLPPIKSHGEVNVHQLQDYYIKSPSSDSNSTASYSNPSSGSGISFVQNLPTGTCNDLVIPNAAMESKISTPPYELEGKIHGLPFEFQMHTPVQVPGYDASPQLNLPQQQKMQTFDGGSHYMSHNPTGMMPVASYIPVYHPMIQQQQQPHYQSNQPCPMYYVPIAQTQQYNYPVQYGMVHTPTFVSGQPQMYSNASVIPPQLLMKEVGATPPLIPELTSQVYRNLPTANQVVHVTYNKTDQDPGLSQIHLQPQSFVLAASDSTNCNSEPNDDPTRIQIYKSQPPPPTFLPQYQTMNKASTALFSEALAQLDPNDIKQEIRALESQ